MKVGVGILVFNGEVGELRDAVLEGNFSMQTGGNDRVGTILSGSLGDLAQFDLGFAAREFRVLDAKVAFETHSLLEWLFARGNRQPHMEFDISCQRRFGVVHESVKSIFYAAAIALDF